MKLEIEGTAKDTQKCLNFHVISHVREENWFYLNY